MLPARVSLFLDFARNGRVTMHKSRRHGLDAMGALATLLASSTVRLNQANVDPPEDTVLLTDFSEATFVGYVAATVVAWSADGIDPDGVPYMLSGTLHFEATSAATPNGIYGVYTEAGAG